MHSTIGQLLGVSRAHLQPFLIPVENFRMRITGLGLLFAAVVRGHGGGHDGHGKADGETIQQYAQRHVGNLSRHTNIEILTLLPDGHRTSYVMCIRLVYRSMSLIFLKPVILSTCGAFSGCMT